MTSGLPWSVVLFIGSRAAGTSNIRGLPPGGSPGRSASASIQTNWIHRDRSLSLPLYVTE